MFHSTNFSSAFSRLRFDVESVQAPLGAGGPFPPPGEEGLRLGLPADPLLEEILCAAPLPLGLIERLHESIDQWSDHSAA